jgi:LysM repeat protein
MRRLFIAFLVLCMVVAPSLAIPRATVTAATISPSEIISLVNSLRTSYGLPALIEDAILNSTAHSTAAQMAANGVCAHIGNARERIAAAGFGGGSTIFATENMACAVSADIGWLQSVWADEVHMWPMTQSKYTHVGAGSYTGSNGTTYYVLHAAYVGDGGSYTSPGVSNNTPAPTVQYVEPVFTVTPQADGSIVHTVKYGQALFTIAAWYGITVEQIMQLNNLINENIYVGQTLIIRLAPTATITPTRTTTPRQPTRTPSLTSTPTQLVTPRTPTPTIVPGLLESLPRIDRQWLGFGLLIISAIGLMTILFLEFIKPRLKK